MSGSPASNAMHFIRSLRAAGLVFSGIALVTTTRAAQPISTVPLEGLRDASLRVHALVGARIVTAPGNVIENGTLVIRDGVIEVVGTGLATPPDARVAVVARPASKRVKALLSPPTSSRRASSIIPPSNKA